MSLGHPSRRQWEIMYGAAFWYDGSPISPALMESLRRREKLVLEVEDLRTLIDAVERYGAASGEKVESTLLLLRAVGGKALTASHSSDTIVSDDEDAGGDDEGSEEAHLEDRGAGMADRDHG